jgi:serine/threonine protein kinase
MTGEPKRDVEVFTEAIQLPDEERIAFLDRVCGKDEDLRRRIEALLRFNERAGDFLEDPPTGSICERRARIAVGEKPGDQVGRYTLLQQIGEGGCGVVFIAEQKEPVRRQVALKVIKPGMDTKSVIARFEAERQALALMDHPNIAHVFDAGATANGRPYFVMELVRGLKITDYCDQKSLSTAQRLDLFVQVCSAVQHAHQKGIIHRDIKPSNVLIAMSPDGKPAPKIIDFGIAKATTGQRLTDKTLFTSFEMLIGTPAYMSPEQAEMTSIDVDTRSDIYSLGVLLYELLTGTTPFDTQELLKSGLDEVRRVIRTKEPVRPSTRLSTMAASDLTLTAQHHHVEPPRLIREVRGDLDWIVIKAMEKDRDRRYATANGLAMDVERFLHEEVVLARPPTAAYKFRKLFQRNKLLFISLASIFLLLVATLAVAARLLVVQQRTVHLARALQWESRASGYVMESKVQEAKDALQQSLAIRRRYLHNEPPPPSTIQQIDNFLIQQDSIGDAVELTSNILMSSTADASSYLTHLANRSEVLGAAGDWKALVPVATFLVKARPNESGGYHRLAPLLVATTNLEAYQQLCLKIVSTFSKTTEFLVADQMAKDCLILPSVGVDLEAVAAMAKLAVTKGKGSGAYDYLVCCEALAQYRLGNYREAIYWAQSSDQIKWRQAKAEASAILAMAQFRSGNIEAARQTMTNCNEFIASNLPTGKPPGSDWRDWIIAHALQSEANLLIEGRASSAASVAPHTR